MTAAETAIPGFVGTEAAIVRKSRELAKAIVLRPDEVDFLVKLPNISGVRRDSARAHEIRIDEHRLPMAALGTVITTALTTYVAPRLRAATPGRYDELERDAYRARGKKLPPIGNWELAGVQLKALQDGVSEVVPEFIRRIEGSQWEPVWRRWSEFLAMEPELDSRAESMSPQVATELGPRLAALHSTQLNLLMQDARCRVEPYDPVRSARDNIGLLMMLQNRQDERSGAMYEALTGWDVASRGIDPFQLVPFRPERLYMAGCLRVTNGILKIVLQPDQVVSRVFRTKVDQRSCRNPIGICPDLTPTDMTFDLERGTGLRRPLPTSLTRLVLELAVDMAAKRVDPDVVEWSSSDSKLPSKTDARMGGIGPELSLCPIATTAAP